MADSSTVPRSKSSYPTHPSSTERARGPPHLGTSSISTETGATVTVHRDLFRVRVRAHLHRRVSSAESGESGTSIAAHTPAATRTVAHHPPHLCAGSHHRCGTSIGRARARVLGRRCAGLVVRWVRGGGRLATSGAGMAVGAARDRIPRRCARAAQGQGRLHAPAPVRAPDLDPSLVPVLVLVRALALSPRRILRGLGAVVGLGLIAAAVEATAGMISGTAGPAHQPRKMCDASFFRALALLHTATLTLKVPNMMLFTADRLRRIYCDFRNARVNK